ncbi:OLC1v1030519C1 [Oldenlandia corymbosa var. corymbosa]|uniref:OLC1v1030519C1 n=1 Tax=Oldenlandia corymbosa var. corymbosa TaxID=529605 RepID=A0AAV1CH36_OLDCO|nr:OLC1v1030519C1 [Oldenlandia corymbosa var. corymbosa]
MFRGITFEKSKELRISILVHTIKPSNALACKTYTEALTTLKLARKSVDDFSDQHFDEKALIATSDFLNCLMSLLWEVLQPVNACAVVPAKDQRLELYEGLRYLRKENVTPVDIGRLSKLLESIKLIMAELGEKEPHVFSRSSTQLAYVDPVLKKLFELKSCGVQPTAMTQAETIQEELVCLRYFLGDIMELQLDDQQELQSLWVHVLGLIY